MTKRRASGLLAWLPSVGFVVAALAFATLLPGQIESGNADGIRWFAFSAFPLAVVAAVAVFTRLQKKIDQQYGRQDEGGMGPSQS